jgi:hypothetical protein
VASADSQAEAQEVRLDFGDACPAYDGLSALWPLTDGILGKRHTENTFEPSFMRGRLHRPFSF